MDALAKQQPVGLAQQRGKELRLEQTALEQIAGVLAGRSQWVVITGAGVSTASGISDYRDQRRRMETTATGSASGVHAALSLASTLLGAQPARISRIYARAAQRRASNPGGARTARLGARGDYSER